MLKAWYYQNLTDEKLRDSGKRLPLTLGIDSKVTKIKIFRGAYISIAFFLSKVQISLISVNKNSL